MSVELRSYQTDSVQGVRASYRAGRRAPLLVLPTGAGKTVTFSYIAHGVQCRGKRVLILAHRRELIRQASRKLADAGVPHGVIAPGFTGTSDLVQVASVQTLARRIETLPSFDLVVIDEAHHAIAGQYARIIAAQPNARLLGVTATPERLDGRGLGIHAGGCFDDMVLGPSVADLIAQGYLTPARVYAPAEKPNLSGVRTKGGDFDVKQLEERVNVATITGDVVAHYGRFAAGLPTIAFCITVQHAQDVAASLRAAGWRAVCGHGGMSPRDRDSAINGLATGDVQILTTCDLVSEGLDVPAVSAAILLRPTKSLGLYLQQVGRGLRPAPGKQHLVVLDHAGCTAVHDMPDAPRDWSLAGRPKANAEPSTMQCPECLAVQRLARKCALCGFAFGSDDDEEREGRELFHEDGDLVEMDEERIARLRAGRLRDLLTGQESRRELEQIAWARGYKPGWVHKVLQDRQLERGAAA